MDGGEGAARTSSGPTDSGDPGWSFEWILAHAKPGPELERYVIPLQLFDPIPPEVPRPPLLLANLVDGEPLELRRVAIPGCACPDFLVTMVRGRELGRITGETAVMIEVARGERIGVEVSVFAAVPSFPSEVALMLQLAVVVWCPPGEWVERPTVFRTQREK